MATCCSWRVATPVPAALGSDFVPRWCGRGGGTRSSTECSRRGRRIADMPAAGVAFHARGAGVLVATRRRSSADLRLCQGGCCCCFIWLCAGRCHLPLRSVDAIGWAWVPLAMLIGSRHRAGGGISRILTRDVPCPAVCCHRGGLRSQPGCRRTPARAPSSLVGVDGSVGRAISAAGRRVPRRGPDYLTPAIMVLFVFVIMLLNAGGVRSTWGLSQMCAGWHPVVTSSWG